MSCRAACIVTDLVFEVKCEDSEHIGLLVNHMKRMETLSSLNDKDASIFTVTEAGLRDLSDFTADYMDRSLMYFRIEGNSEWRTFLQVGDVFSSEWIDELIQQERLISYYQPIVDKDQVIYGYELLARFHSPEGEIIFPDEAFTAARNRGRLYALDRLCRVTAVRHAAPLINLKAFINFIPTAIYSPEFCLQSTVAVANQYHIDPYQLVFEVVETDQVEDVEHLKSILRYYREKGFHYALDDVGEGFNTVELLAELQPNYMKLDRSYVDGVAQDVRKQENAELFLKKARESHSIPLAEGIEQEEDYRWLKNAGYELFQGYYFGKPAPFPV